MNAVNCCLAEALEALQSKEYSKAEEILSLGVAEATKTFGETDLVTAQQLGHLAGVLIAQNKRELAIPMYKRLLLIHQNLPQPSSTDHAAALFGLSSALVDQDSEESVALKEKGDAMLEEIAARMSSLQKREPVEEVDSESQGSDSDDHSESTSFGESCTADEVTIG